MLHELARLNRESSSPGAAPTVSLMDLSGRGRTEVCILGRHGMDVLTAEAQGPVFRRIALTEPLPDRPASALPLDIDGDGQDEILVHSPAGLNVLARQSGAFWGRLPADAPDSGPEPRGQAAAVGILFALPVPEGNGQFEGIVAAAGGCVRAWWNRAPNTRASGGQEAARVRIGACASRMLTEGGEEFRDLALSWAGDSPELLGLTRTGVYRLGKVPAPALAAVSERGLLSAADPEARERAVVSAQLLASLPLGRPDALSWVALDDSPGSSLLIVDSQRRGGWNLSAPSGDGIEVPGLEDLRHSRQLCAADLDNDGELELLAIDAEGWLRMFRQHGPRWDEVAGEVPEGLPDPQAVMAICDLNGDGTLELVLIMPGSASVSILGTAESRWNPWLTVVPQTAAGAPARGAVVMLDSGDGPRYRVIPAGGSALAGGPEAHFGLGEATAANLIQVRFPDGQLVELKDVAARQRLVVSPA